MTTEFKDRLKSARKHARMTQIELAKAVGTSQGSISDLEAGRNKTSTNTVKMAQILGVNPDWLATGQGSMLATKSSPALSDSNAYNAEFVRNPKIAPVINMIQAGTFTDIGDNVYDEYLPYLGDWENSSVFWLKLAGTSMRPDFDDGEYVLINRDLQPVAGDFVAAIKDGENQATFKKYRPKGFDTNGVEYWQLIPSNDEFPIIDSRFEPFQVIGVGVEHNKMLVENR